MQKAKLRGANGVHTLRKHSNSLRLVQRKPLSACDDTAFREGAVYCVNYCQRSPGPELPVPAVYLRSYSGPRSIRANPTLLAVAQLASALQPGFVIRSPRG